LALASATTTTKKKEKRKKEINNELNFSPFIPVTVV
jgi:hypothetical protein